MTDPCKSRLMPIKDTLDIVGGKWKLLILHDLMYHGKRRFKELQRDLDGITSRVLSAELKQLEQNELVTREAFNTAPPTVVYTLTEYGYTLKYVITALHTWGTHHRERIFHGSEEIINSLPNDQVEKCGLALVAARNKKELVESH
jgi:DNA-binding HxlR family transcriptional regulator